MKYQLCIQSEKDDPIHRALQSVAKLCGISFVTRLDGEFDRILSTAALVLNCNGWSHETISYILRTASKNQNFGPALIIPPMTQAISGLSDSLLFFSITQLLLAMSIHEDAIRFAHENFQHLNDKSCKYLADKVGEFLDSRLNGCKNHDIRSFFEHMKKYLSSKGATAILDDNKVQIFNQVIQEVRYDDWNRMVSQEPSVRNSPNNLSNGTELKRRKKKKISCKVLIVENSVDDAEKLRNGLENCFEHSKSTFNIEFRTFTPENENSNEFKKRFEERIRMDKDLQIVIFDHNLYGEGELNGIALAKITRNLRPLVSNILFSIERTLGLIENTRGVIDFCCQKSARNAELEYSDIYKWIVKSLNEKYEAPFWMALKAYAERPITVGHAMPSSSGRSLRKGASLEDFLKFYGDKYFNAETSATLQPLDSLLEPKGSLKAAMSKAAVVFGAKRTYFVTNGTSTANKIVLQAISKPGDTILLDRNCHISHHYGTAMMGIKPIYLEPFHIRDLGISGGIEWETIKVELGKALKVYSEKKCKRDIPRALLITNCTFDGIISNPVSIIKDVKKLLVEMEFSDEDQKFIFENLVFFFDEAWFAFARFHPKYIERTGMYAANFLTTQSDENDKDWEFYQNHLRIYVTQSIHKTLSSFRQGSMIHVWDPRLDSESRIEQAFNVAFAAHTSTSPHYGMLASLDVAVRQVALEGFPLVDEILDLATTFREDRPQHLTGNYKKDPWNGVFEVVTAADLNCNKAFNLDETKVTIRILKGPKGSELKKTLLEHDIQINKYSENSVLFMINIGASNSSITHLKMVLMQIASKVVQAENREKNNRIKTIGSQPEPSLPNFSRFWPGKCQGINPGKDRNISFFFNNMADWATEFLELHDRSLVGRYSTRFVSPYPPGYPILVPGQEIDVAVWEYLKGITSTEIHGLEDGRIEVFIIP